MHDLLPARDAAADPIAPDPEAGRIVWDPAASLWNGSMLAIALSFGVQTFSLPSLCVSVALGALTTLAMSVGLHRLLAHAAFSAGPWTTRVLAWLGVLTGLGGPLGAVGAHHLSDWAQHRPAAHPFFMHRRSLATHLVWRMHGRIDLAHPPVFDLSRIERDPVLRLLERTWMLQQTPVAALLFLMGGWSFVVWGICVRVAVTTIGYWTVAHLAHHPVGQAAESETPGNDIAWAGLVSMGEAWHRNHHDHPTSARIGLYQGQIDLGWRFIQTLERLGLVWDVRTPEAVTPVLHLHAEH
ncbi:acyl-CoA desaturase [Brevundimonas sp.]|uniref:acyl-CoA desaturase n=1 Tax=Brevundimonas sp. TaxID=1871086 RepID=UPI003D0A95D2